VKLLTLLFAIYILFLPCMPCTDGTEPVGNNTTTHSQNQEHEEHEKDSCPPFCSCLCCGQTVATYQNIKIQLPVPALKSSTSYFTNNIFLCANYFGSIWQPPKLV
jgi:hypothetical protein